MLLLCLNRVGTVGGSALMGGVVTEVSDLHALERDSTPVGAAKVVYPDSNARP